MFDLSDRGSFSNLTKWLDDVERLTTDCPIKLIVANKADLKERVVSKEEVKEFSARSNIEVIEASAKDGFQVSYVFEYICGLLMNRE